MDKALAKKLLCLSRLSVESRNGARWYPVVRTLAVSTPKTGALLANLHFKS